MLQTKEFVQKLSEQNRDFCILGLTGKVKSGISDVCKLLTSRDFCNYVKPPADTEGFLMGEIREHKLMHRYLHHNWRPFIELSVSGVITSFLLDSIAEDLPTMEDKAEIAIERILKHCLTDGFPPFMDQVLQRTAEIHLIMLYYGSGRECPGGFYDDKACKTLLERIRDEQKFLKEWKSVRDGLIAQTYTYDMFLFCYGILPVLGNTIRNTLEKKDYTAMFQDFGNNIRAYGRAVFQEGHEPDARYMFYLPERINHFIKVLRHYPIPRANPVSSAEAANSKWPIFVVINNFKNIFEAHYFKKRYASFYLIAVSCDEAIRRTKFNDIHEYKLTDLKENLASGKNIYKSVAKYREDHKEESQDFSVSEPGLKETLGLNKGELDFAKQLYGASGNLRMISYKWNIAPFILQDVVTCVENADIFVMRDYRESDYKCDYPLIRLLGRIVTLILHPGLLTPTKLERCMQIAMTAKLNSGCLSRQVGAVVTDAEYNILSLGWNDSPCGVESCIRRNFFDLLSKNDPYAYSEYELSDHEFRAYLDTINKAFNDSKNELGGLPLAFCFKDIYQDIIRQRDQIYTRALHGEERALATCGNERTKGGYLFTTSSPCELCAKKAKEAKISVIYYIEQYPGISRTHIIEAGDKNSRAKFELFVGAVGLAYVKLYTPLMPYKDELAAFEFSPVDIHSDVVSKKKLPSQDISGLPANGPAQLPNDVQPHQ